MKKGIWALSLIFIFSLFIPPALEAKVDEARRIRELEKRIEALEEEKRGFRPDRAEWLEFGGEMRLDLIVPEEAESYVYLDRLELDIRALLAEGVYTAGAFRIEADPQEPGDFSIEVDEWYTRFSLEDHWLKAGLTDRFIAPGDIDLGHRRTAGYPLSGNAFWRDEQYNLTFGGMFPGVAGGDLRYRLSYGSGLALRDRRPGDHRFFYLPREDDELFHDDDHGQDGDEIGLGLGYRLHFFPEATLDLVGFGIWSRIPRDEEPAGEDLVGWPEENSQRRQGVRVVYGAEVPWGETLLMAEYIDAQDGKLDRDAWYLQAGHEFEFAPLIGGRFLTGIEPVIRYGHYNVDVAKDFEDPLTWDRQQLTLALLCDLTRDVSLRIEHDINNEETGGKEIENNEFRVQLRTRF